MYTSYVFVSDISVLIFRASYDTAAPNAKRKYQDEGETDEDKMEEYKASREWDSVLVKKKNKSLQSVESYLGKQI